MPRLTVFDYDKDGTKDIIVSLNVDSGTGIGIDELHFLKISGDSFIDNQYKSEDYMKDTAEQITYRFYNQDKNVMINIKSESSSLDIDLTNYAKEYGITEFDSRLAFGSMIEFTPTEGGKIEMEVLLGVTNQAYIAKMTADVTFLNGKFQLSNVWLKED